MTDLPSLRLRRDGGVLHVEIDHPPMNLVDSGLVGQLAELVTALERDADTRVVVFGSADPDYFLAHYDVEELLGRPAPTPVRVGGLKPFHQLLERYRALPQVTIGRIEGRARGAGSEFLLALDLRFAAAGRAVLSQFEVAVGLLPGGAGTQNLPALVGRARALEIICAGADVDAERAERYGWVNRALPPDELAGFVDSVAKRIASHPADAVRRAKRSVEMSERGRYEGLREEAQLFGELLAMPATTRRIRAFLAAGGQTRTGELDMDGLLDATRADHRAG
ncbi:MAG TPA: enoyl-CoA hydratase/isomerase family protein [Actinocatenispora sp.]